MTMAQLNNQLAQNIRCIRDTIYTEARGENEYGRALVGYVLLSRWRDQKSRSLCELAYQVDVKGGKRVSQFSGNIYHPVLFDDEDPRLQEIARLAVWVYLGYFEPLPQHRCARAYQRIEHADPNRQGWFSTLRLITKVGNHTFYCLS